MIARLRWPAWQDGASAYWQVLGTLLVWCYVVALHWDNDGLWYQGDSSRHAVNGLFWWDFLAHFPTNALTFALSYYARYPVISPTAYPPFFYLLEGAAYRLFGISPFVAKGLILLFLLLGTIYLLAWLRRWIAPPVGWAGLLFVLQPGTIIWSHAVMLNVPSVALGIATLYHARRWLDDPPSRHIYLTAVFGILAILTYLPIAVCAPIIFLWMISRRQTRLLLQRKSLIVVAFAFLPVASWGVVALKWASSQSTIAFQLGEYPPWKLAGWTYYAHQLRLLTTAPLLVAALAAAGLVPLGRRWRRELAVLVIWLAGAYVWFSLISYKESRYVLFLVPPVIALAALFLTALSERAAPALRAAPAGAISAALLLFVLIHATLAMSVDIPRVVGFREVAAFIQESAPAQRIFYEGKYNGVVSFYVRSGDATFAQSITLGSKLIYATRLGPQWGLVQHASSSEDVAALLEKGCGCRFLIVERQISREMMNVDAVRTLRSVLHGGSFRFIRTFRIRTTDVSDIDVFEPKTIPATPNEVELSFPFLGKGYIFNAKPIER